MSTATLTSASVLRNSPRRPLTIIALFGLLVLGWGLPFPATPWTWSASSA